MAGSVSDEDLQRWVDKGIITEDQRAAIASDLAVQPNQERLTLVTVLYYGGGLLVLLAYAVFLGFQWEGLSPETRVAIMAASLAFFAGVSTVLLRSSEFRLPGELLQVVAVAIVPLLSFALLDLAGVWPEDPNYTQFGDEQQDYETDLTWARMALAGATFIAAAAAFWLSRSPFALIAALGSSAALILDVTLQAEGSRTDYHFETAQSAVAAAMGTATLGAAIWSRGRTERDYSLWLSVAGLAGLGFGLGIPAFDSDEAAYWGVLWMVAAVVILALAVVFQERLFAVAGIGAIFAYCAKLMFEVFNSTEAALGMAGLGLLVVVAAMAYQRLTERPAAVG